MKGKGVCLSLLAFLLALGLGAGSLATEPEGPAVPAEPGELGVCLLEDGDAFDAWQVAQVKRPPQTGCCDPALEPGVGGNPLCYEGHTCCSDGVWRCNNPDGSPSCDPGEVCPEGCGQRGDACDEDADCCSLNCGKNGRCK